MAQLRPSLSALALLAMSAFALHVPEVTAAVTVVIHSDALQKDITYHVRVPGAFHSEVNRIFPVPYCLHGSKHEGEFWNGCSDEVIVSHYRYFSVPNVSMWRDQFPFSDDRKYG